MVNLLLTLTLAGVIASLAAAYFLFVWFDGAKFFVEYLNLFKADRFLTHLKNFNKIKSQGSPSSYLDYISDNYNNFLVRLVTCPKCFSIWVALAFWLLLSLTTLSFDLLKSAPIGAFLSAFLSYHLYKLTK